MSPRRNHGGKSTLTLRTVWTAAFIALAAASIFIAGAVGTGTPTITSDKADYTAGSTVNLSGTNWEPGTTNKVHIVVNDSVGNTWQHIADVAPAADVDFVVGARVEFR